MKKGGIRTEEAQRWSRCRSCLRAFAATSQQKAKKARPPDPDLGSASPAVTVSAARRRAGPPRLSRPSSFRFTPASASTTARGSRRGARARLQPGRRRAAARATRPPLKVTALTAISYNLASRSLAPFRAVRATSPAGSAAAPSRSAAMRPRSGSPTAAPSSPAGSRPGSTVLTPPSRARSHRRSAIRSASAAPTA